MDAGNMIKVTNLLLQSMKIEAEDISIRDLILADGRGNKFFAFDIEINEKVSKEFGVLWLPEYDEDEEKSIDQAQGWEVIPPLLEKIFENAGFTVGDLRSEYEKKRFNQHKIQFNVSDPGEHSMSFRVYGRIKASWE